MQAITDDPHEISDCAGRTFAIFDGAGCRVTVNGENAGEMARALIASFNSAIETPPPVKHLRVKTLEWKKVALDSNEWNWLEIAKAETPFATYSLQKHTKGFLRVIFGTQRVGHFEPDQRAEAEASAQSDFAGRIREALATPSPQSNDATKPAQSLGAGLAESRGSVAARLNRETVRSYPDPDTYPKGVDHGLQASPLANVSGSLSVEANDRFEGNGVDNPTHCVRNFKHLTIDDGAAQDLLTHHLPSGEDGLVVGEIVGGKLRAFKVLLKGTVLTHVEIIPGHVLSFQPVTSNSEPKAAFPLAPVIRAVP